MIDNDPDTRSADLQDDTEIGMECLSFVEVFAIPSFAIMSYRVDDKVISSYEFLLRFLCTEADISIRRLLLHLRKSAFSVHASADHINIQVRFGFCRA